jgi:hypothetical protein
MMQNVRRRDSLEEHFSNSTAATVYLHKREHDWLRIRHIFVSLHPQVRMHADQTGTMVEVCVPRTPTLTRRWRLGFEL